MIYGVPEVIHHLSKEVELAAGDIIYTGTPAGVDTVVPGDVVVCSAAAPDGEAVVPPCAFAISLPEFAVF